MKYKCFNNFEKMICDPRTKIHNRSFSKDECKRLKSLLEAIETEAIGLNLNEERAREFLGFVFDAFLSTSQHDYDISWGVINPLKPLKYTKNILKKAESAFRTLETIPNKVLRTLVMNYTESYITDINLYFAILKTELFTREGFRRLAIECEAERMDNKRDVKKAGKSRHGGFVRRKLIQKLFFVWKHHLGSYPKTSRDSAFYAIIKALFSALELSGSNEPDKIIRLEIKSLRNRYQKELSEELNAT